MNITITADQFRALVLGEPVELGRITAAHPTEGDSEPITVILEDMGFGLMNEHLHEAMRTLPPRPVDARARDARQHDL